MHDLTHGSVYNLTSFVSQHPGGSAAVKSLWGIDGTSAYMGQHGGAGRPFASLAAKEKLPLLLSGAVSAFCWTAAAVLGYIVTNM